MGQGVLADVGLENCASGFLLPHRGSLSCLGLKAEAILGLGFGTGCHGLEFRFPCCPPSARRAMHSLSAGPKALASRDHASPVLVPVTWNSLARGSRPST